MYKYIDINTIRFTLSSEKQILILGILKDIYKAWQTPFGTGTRMVCALYSHCKKTYIFFSQRKWYLEKRQVPWLREILDVNKYHERRRKLYNKAQGHVTDIKKHCHKGVVITQYRWKRSIPSKRDMNVSERTQCEGMRRIYTISVAWTVSVSCDVEGYINWMSIN